MKPVILVAWAMALFANGAWMDYTLTHFRSKASCEAMGTTFMAQRHEIEDYICVDVTKEPEVKS